MSSTHYYNDSLSVSVFVESSPFIRQFIGIFRERKRAVLLYGGAARDLLLKGPSIKPRDYDFAIDTDMMAEVEKCFASRIVGRNRFGGLQLRWRTIKIDCWPIESTWAFHYGGLSYRNWRDLAKASFLDVDGVVVRISDQIEFECGPFDCARKNRTINLCHHSTVNKTIALFRALVLGNKYQYRLGDSLLAKFRPGECILNWKLFSELVQRRYSRGEICPFLEYSLNEIPDSFAEIRNALIQIICDERMPNQLELKLQARANRCA